MSTILLVETNPTYRRQLETALQSHRVRLAQTRQELAGLLTARRSGLPDLIILDWLRPDGATLQALRWLRDFPFTGPILVLTPAEVFERVQPQAERQGATVVLRKSASLKHVQRTVEQLLNAQVNGSHALRLDGHVARRLEYPHPSVSLTPTQVELLQILLEAPPGQFVAAEELASRLIVYDHGTDISELVAKRVSRLRVRLDRLEVEIECQRGQGYRLVILVRRAASRK